MREKEFRELLEGIKQAREIMAGKRKPSRVFVFDRLEVKSIRKRLAG